MVGPVSSRTRSNGILGSYTYASAKQAAAVRSALDTANMSAAHKDATKALNTLKGVTTSPSQVEANKAIATLSGATPSASQAAANKALITMTALVDATDSTQKLILAAKASSPRAAASGSSFTGGFAGGRLNLLT